MKNLLVSLFIVIGANSFAGDVGGHGGGALARLLTHIKGELIHSLPWPGAVDFDTADMTRWYTKSHGKMVSELSSLRFHPTDETIRDSYFGYESWIRIRSSADFVMEYSPDVEKYSRLVGAINFRYRHAGSTMNATPAISDVAEYVLHEIGHRYGLEEEEAWAFAQSLSKSIKFNKPPEAMHCELYHFKTNEIRRIEFKAVPAHVSQIKNDDDFEIAYRIDASSFELMVQVRDLKRHTIAFHAQAAADRLIKAGSSLLGGWTISCD